MEEFPAWLRDKHGLAGASSLTTTSYVQAIVNRAAHRFTTDTPLEEIIASDQIGAVMNGYDGKYGAGHRAAWRHFSAFMAEKGIPTFQIPKRRGGRPPTVKLALEERYAPILEAVKVVGTAFLKSRHTSVRRLVKLRWRDVRSMRDPESGRDFIHVFHKPGQSAMFPADLHGLTVFGPLARWASGKDALPTPDAPLIAAASGSPEPMGEAIIKKIIAYEPAPRDNGNGNGADLFDPVNET